MRALVTRQFDGDREPAVHSNQSMSKSQLIAHRGLPQRFPENTLQGLQAAVDCGARWLEIDVQLTADQTPILYHDDQADRVSGISQSVMETSLGDLQRYGAYCPDQFGARFRGLPVSTLRQLMHQVNEWPQAKLFVEIKKHSIIHFGADVVSERVLADLAELIEPDRIAAVISFHDGILQRFREATWPVGWVVREWSEASEGLAAEMQPEFLFIKDARVPDDDDLVWQGRWDWAVYPVDQIDQAIAWRERGWSFVETNVLDQIIDHPDWTRVDKHDDEFESV